MLSPARNPFVWESIAESGALPVLLIRHGQTAWNKERRFLGRSDIPLDDLGRRQAGLLADALSSVPFSAVHTSHLARAMGTARALTMGRDLDPVTVTDLQELDQGELEGQLGSTLPERYPDFLAAWVKDPTHVRVPGGETLDECRKRAMKALQTICGSRQTCAPIAVVSHRMLLGCVICDILDLPLKFVQVVGQKNTAISVLSWRDGRFELHHLNDADHLGDTPTVPAMPA